MLLSTLCDECGFAESLGENYCIRTSAISIPYSRSIGTVTAAVAEWLRWQKSHSAASV